MPAVCQVLEWSVKDVILLLKKSFCNAFSATFSAFLCFLLLLVILLFKMAPQHSAEVLCSVPRHEKPMMCLIKQDTH